MFFLSKNRSTHEERLWRKMSTLRNLLGVPLHKVQGSKVKLVEALPCPVPIVVECGWVPLMKEGGDCTF